MPRTSTARDTSIRTYRAKRNFDVTTEPAPKANARPSAAPMFVVQKHAAHRAGLHWDFRLEHGGVLWSWAVRKGPSLDPADKRIAVHVEDHPLDYADFQGTIPDGEYGAGKVETWDRGTWEALDDPEAGLRDGELRFVLHGDRLNGRFTLVRLRPRPNQRGRQDNWLLIKGHDDAERAGADAPAIEQAAPRPRAAGKKPAKQRDAAPAKGATRGQLPRQQAPQLASPAEATPKGAGWLSEIKFDGYRLLCWIDHGKVHLVTRSGLDWTDRFPAVAREVGRLGVETALLDGELVALDKAGASSFPMLQTALTNGRDATLTLYLFDLLHLNGWDLRPCALADRKRVLSELADWRGMLRYSDHHTGDPARLHYKACEMGLEGTVCKRADAPYRAGRGPGWVKVKCLGREEFVVLGWTTPGGSRTGLGSLHLGYYDADGGLHYAGGVGTGFSEQELTRLSEQLAGLAAGTPHALLLAGDPLPAGIHWVRPELVAEVQYANWSGSGRVRHAVYLGLREDKPPADVVREIADPDAERKMVKPRQAPGNATIAKPRRRVVIARAPKQRGTTIGGIALTHPERELWPGITKQDLAEYWLAVAEHALPGLAHRPLAVVRCPSGIAGEHFFQKHGHGGMPAAIRDGEAAGSPFLAIDGADGLVALAQMSAIELHAWGATEKDPLHPDLIVFDLDPGEGVPFASVASAAHDVRENLRRIGLESFCRTTGGKGLHVVAPIGPDGDWDAVKPFCRAFAETMSQENPDAYLPTMRKLDRRGKILIDWLRNGLGATAVASFCPRARPGANVATPVAWGEVNDKLNPADFTLRSVPDRLARLRADPWQEFTSLRQRLPDLTTGPAAPKSGRNGARTDTRIVQASKPKRRARQPAPG
jgi:bifunctional non-homologous end joining protein LigD